MRSVISMLSILPTRKGALATACSRSRTLASVGVTLALALEVGRSETTMTRWAPSRSAGLMGTLSRRPPSTWSSPRTRTAGKITGMAAEASAWLGPMRVATAR